MNEQRAGAVFAALGDATRRKVVAALTARGPLSATELAAGLPVTRQAIAKHLTTLAEAGLVTADREGRELRWRLTPESMADAMDWMAEAGAEWDERIRRLRRHLRA